MSSASSCEVDRHCLNQFYGAPTLSRGFEHKNTDHSLGAQVDVFELTWWRKNFFRQRGPNECCFNSAWQEDSRKVFGLGLGRFIEHFWAVKVTAKSAKFHDLADLTLASTPEWVLPRGAPPRRVLRRVPHPLPRPICQVAQLWARLVPHVRFF